MIIVRMSGGLGNQLFQYATALQIAKKNNFPLLLDISSYTKSSIRKFSLDELIPSVSIIPKDYLNTLVEPQNIILKNISKLLNWKRIPKIVESVKGYNPQIANISFSCYLKGSFISFHYFDFVSDLLIESLVFNEDIKMAAYLSIKEYNGYNLVCVSIRRGDFLEYESLNVCGKNFYNRCIESARNILSNPKFLFFSDDINWVRYNFISSDFLYWDVQNYNLIMKLYAMTLCDHFIISNSSYSWWGAWLNKSNSKKVFCPSKVELDDSFPIDDYYPNFWIKINP